jgi:RNA polymerase sigma-70 factor (ECF subfamily)
MNPLAHPEALIKRVYAYVAYRIGDGPDAEDVTSAVFERALRYRDSYDRRKGTPVSWLIGIARREIDSALAGRPLLVTGEDAFEQEAPGNLADDAARRLTMAAAVASLDARDRELVALRYGADLTARQIGELLGMQTNAVEVALHRALARLRAELGPDGAPEAVRPEPAPAGAA